MATKHTISQAKYDREHRRTYGFRLHNELDKDIIEKLASVPSMQGYVKQLIREDIARTRSVSAPVPETKPTRKKGKAALEKDILAYLEKFTGEYDDSMYELLNAITMRYMGG